MKRSHLLLFLITFATFVFAYDYQTVSSNRICLYKNDGYIGLRIDSVKSHGQDSVFYPNVNFFTFNDTFRIDGSWIGKRIIVKPNGDNVFINRANDSILIKTLAALKESWLVYQKNGMLKITAEVTSLEKTTVIGLDDSVKTITFHVFDASMKPIANGYEGKQIKISQHYGIIESKSFYYFPDLINSSFNLLYKLGGMTNPKVGVQNLLAKDIWDFNEGDEFHTFSHYDRLIAVDTTSRICRVLDRFEINGALFVRLDIESRYAHQSLASYPYYYVYCNRDTFLIDTSKLTELNKLPGETDAESIGSQLSMPTENVKELHSGYCLMPFDSVNWVIGCTDGTIDSELYFRGFGGLFYSGWYSNETLPRSLAYYKKNNVEWGTKLVITSIPSVVKENSLKFFSVFGHKELTVNITSSELPARLEVLSVSGSVVVKRVLNSESSTISLQSLPAGAYLYRVKGGSGGISSGKIILH